MTTINQHLMRMQKISEKFGAPSEDPSQNQSFREDVMQSIRASHRAKSHGNLNFRHALKYSDRKVTPE